MKTICVAKNEALHRRKTAASFACKAAKILQITGVLQKKSKKEKKKKRKNCKSVSAKYARPKSSQRQQPLWSAIIVFIEENILEVVSLAKVATVFFLNTPSPPTPSPPSDDGTNHFLTVLFFLSLTSRDPPPQPGHPSLSPQTP